MNSADISNLTHVKFIITLSNKFIKGKTLK